MAERFRFFDPVLVDGVPDRDYNAQEFTDYFKALVTTGVMKGAGNELKASASGSNMVTTIETGIAFIGGRYYENDALLPHTHDTETLGKSRIDRVVVRLDLNTDARYVKSFVRKGVASAAPVAPSLQRDALVYEISLAQVKVIGGQTYINVADVVDERGKDVICPWAGSNILPSFDDNALNEHIKDNIRHTNIVSVISTDSSSYLDFSATLNGVTELYDGLSVTFKVDKNTPKSIRLNLNGLGAKLILSSLGGPTQGSSLTIGAFITLRYSSSLNFWVYEGFNQTPVDSGNVNLAFGTGWTYGSVSPMIRKYSSFIFVEFSSTPIATSSPKIMGQLPVDYRPLNPAGFLIYGKKSGAFQVFNGILDTNGNLTIGTDTSVANLSLTDAVSFNFAFYKP